MKYTFTSKSELETLNLGKMLASFLNIGDVLLLRGDLGAGKTTLTKGLALGLNINEKVNSPTFNIMKHYLKGDKPLFHIDAYRLENNHDDIGLDEFIGTDGITVIEWPDYIDYLLPKDALNITITHTSLLLREVILEGEGRYANIIVKIAEKLK